MNLSVLHRRLMQDVLEIGNSLPLVITGGYAVQAHQLVDRLSRDIDVATDSDIPMEDIVAVVVAGLTARGWDMCIIGVDPRSARMTATDRLLASNANWTSLGKSSTNPRQLRHTVRSLPSMTSSAPRSGLSLGEGYRAISSTSTLRRNCARTSS
jgi:hypothetical protein